LLDPIEEPFDPVAGAVEIRAEADWIASIAFGRDVGPRAFLHRELPDPIGIVDMGSECQLSFKERQFGII
jgi:hypothetical protein